MAVVAFLQRMHGPNHRNRVIFLWTVAGSNAIMNLITMIMNLTQCTPVSKAWDALEPGSCADISRMQNYNYAQGSLSALCDFILALYPVTFFWELQLKRSVKIGLCMLMGLGILPGICAICKTVKFQQLVIATLADIPKHPSSEADFDNHMIIFSLPILQYRDVGGFDRGLHSSDTPSLPPNIRQGVKFYAHNNRSNRRKD
ncbi:hypothetical protein V8E54_014650 [Elaphomyces granulatus]